MEVNPTLRSPKDSVPDGAFDAVNPQEHTVTVLLVEDTEDNRQMMKKLLELSDFRVVEATNGREAVELARRVRPQIILMDLSLPFVDGLAATRQIRSLPGLSKVPIVAVSAHDTTDFHSEALDAGCNAYVTKPIYYPELEDLVNRLLAEIH
jgi:two-component system cell cycle response regulator DivK